MDGLFILVRQSSHPVMGRLKGGLELRVGTILSSRRGAKVVVAVGGNKSSVHLMVDSSHCNHLELLYRENINKYVVH
jgi:hypothetical protein